MVATAGLEMLHDPPVVALLSVVVLPTQREVMPVMGEVGLMVKDTVATQPAVVIYVITTPPAEMPEATPVVTPTDAIRVLVLLHVPPVAASAKVMVLPWQMVSGPVMAAREFTVTSMAAMQPEGVVYWMVAVPAETPDTIPVTGSVVATAGFRLLQEPPPEE